MATSAVIARRAGDGWAGVYHHWDGYPSGLGRTLWLLLWEEFRGDVEGLLRFVIDDHPGGWSHLKPGPVVRRSPDGEDVLDGDAAERQCYCHGYFAERDGYVPARYAGCSCGDLGTDADCDPLTIRWVYVLDPKARSLAVLRSTGSGARRRHREVARLLLDGPEPDWQALDAGRSWAGAGGDGG